MPFEEVREPVSGAKAFAGQDDASLLSQAAVLLLIGSQPRADSSRTRRLLDFRGEPRAAGTTPEEQDELALGLPALQPVVGLVDTTRIKQLLYNRVGLKETLSEEAGPILQAGSDICAELADKHFREPTANNAFNLLEISLLHPNELVRVAAAAGYMGHSSEKERLLTILRNGVRSKEPLVRNVAATALARENPDDPRLRELLGQRKAPGAAGAADTTMIIHGTWAANSSWWQPGGDFHTYILNSVRPDLYSKPDRFGWSGGYSDGARAAAAQELVQWVTGHNEQGLDLITHSHGGSVAMLATTLNPNLRIGELILLSCPVHFPKYQPDFSQISKRTVSIRVHLDLVILADRGGQRFNVPQITENVLGIWFDHSATHSPSVWQKYNVPNMI